MQAGATLIAIVEAHADGAAGSDEAGSGRARFTPLLSLLSLPYTLRHRLCLHVATQITTLQTHPPPATPPPPPPRAPPPAPAVISSPPPPGAPVGAFLAWARRHGGGGIT